MAMVFKNNVAKTPPDIVYLDTTIVSFYFDKRPEYRLFRESTEEWLQIRSSQFYVCSSMVAQNELGDGDYLHKEEALRFFKKIAVLPINEQIMDIARFYIEKYLAPKENIEEYRGDALHLAICAFYKVDYLLSWNQRHLANVNKLRQLKIMNARLNLSTPEIITPAQLLL